MTRLSIYLRLLRVHWLMLVSITALGIAGAAALKIFSPVSYSSTASTFVSAGSSADIVDANTGSSFVQQAVKSYTSVATSPYVLGRVVSDLGLHTTAQELSERVAASAPLDETVINITARSASPSDAARTANAIAARLSAAVNELAVSGGSQNALVRITTISSAVPATRPDGPSLVQVLIYGFLVGGIVGGCVIVARERLDTKLRHAASLEELHDGTILGQTAQDPRASLGALTMVREPNGPASEAYRTLQANLRYVPTGPGARKFVVTSAIPAEGKSTLTANLGIACAEAGQRTLLIEADMRRPMLANYLGLDSSMGLSDVLAREAKPQDAVQSWGEGRAALDVLPAGAVPPNPGELLQSDSLAELLSLLAESYDVILLDAPPVLAVADAAVLTRVADGALIATRFGFVRIPQIRSAVQKLLALDARVIGFVVTGVRRRDEVEYVYGSYDYVSRTV